MSLQSVNRTIKYFDKLKQNDVTGSTIILYCTTTQQEWHLLIAANKVCCFKHVLGTCKGRVKKNKKNMDLSVFGWVGGSGWGQYP